MTHSYRVDGIGNYACGTFRKLYSCTIVCQCNGIGTLLVGAFGNSILTLEYATIGIGNSTFVQTSISYILALQYATSMVLETLLMGTFRNYILTSV